MIYAKICLFHLYLHLYYEGTFVPENGLFFTSQLLIFIYILKYVHIINVHSYMCKQIFFLK